MSAYPFDSDFDVDVAHRWLEEADLRRDAMRDEQRVQSERARDAGWHPSRDELDDAAGEL